MVNKTVLSFLICFSLLSAEKILGQDAYYDALILGKYSWQVDPDENKYVFVDTNEMNVENLINILNKYFPGDTTYNQLNYAITGNPFFRLKEFCLRLRSVRMIWVKLLESREGLQMQ